MFEDVVVDPALVGIERIIAGGREPLAGRRLDRRGGREQVFGGERPGTPAFIASRSFASMARSTTAFRSAPEKWSVFLARCS